MKHLHERLDDLFADGNPWKHRTLRTLFDPASAEWNMTTMDEKVEILKRLHASGERLGKISREYQQFYRDNMNRPDIANDFDNGLIVLTEHLLEKKK